MATLNPVPLPVTETDGANVALGTTTDAAVTNPASAASAIALAKGELTVLTNGTVKAIARGGAKGSTTAADVTSTASGANHNAQDVILYDAAGNPYVFPAALGQGTMAQGFRVVLPTDQASIPVAATLAAGAAKVGIVTTDQTTHGTTDLVAADITKVAGAAISQGHGTAATAIRVELPTDGTGLVGMTGKNTEFTGTAASLNADAIASTDMAGYGIGVLQITGTFTGTITVASSNDNSTFVTQTIHPTGTITGTDATNLASTGIWVFPKTGRFIRVRMTAYTSGTATATLEMSNDAAAYFSQAVYTNVAYLNGNFVATNNGTGSTGALRVCVASDNTAFNVNLGNAAAALADGTTNWTSTLVGAGQVLYNGATWDRQRTPNTFKTATATASGDTALWTPTSGKKFRLMRYMIQVSGDAATAGGADIDVILRDATTGTAAAFTVFVPAVAATTFGNTATTGWVDLGNGILSATINQVLNINLSAALTAGKVRVVACGTEE